MFEYFKETMSWRGDETVSQTLEVERKLFSRNVNELTLDVK